MAAGVTPIAGVEGSHAMLRVGSSLRGYSIEASDGRIGAVSDILFDDISWTMRWLVIDTGTWLPGRQVLLHPSAIGAVDFEMKTMAIALTRSKIKNSPNILQDEPVSRQMELGLCDYYSWNAMWDGAADRSPGLRDPSGRALAGADLRMDEGDPHLRSMAAVIGYTIQATDGSTGHLEELLIEDRNWVINYLVVDTRNWWPGQHVLLAPFAVHELDSRSHTINLRITRALVKASPPWQPGMVVNDVYQKQLHAHYGWPSYTSNDHAIGSQLRAAAE
jgi:hypothetical protein